MTMTFMKREEIARRRLRTKLVLFFREKWSYLLHHAFIAVGYPVIAVRKKLIPLLSVVTDPQNDHLRGYKGDFYAAALLGQDLSNPLLANAKMLNIVSKGGINRNKDNLDCFPIARTD